MEAQTDHSGKLRAAIMQGVEAAGLEIIPGSRLTEGLARCAPPACLASVAKTTGATHVVRVDGRYADQRFRVTIQLWDTRAAALVSSSARSCLICDQGDFFDAAAEGTKTLLTDALAVRTGPRAADPTAVESRSSRSPAQPPEVTAATRPPPSPTTSGTQGWEPLRLWTGMSLAVAGVVGVGLGLYYNNIDGEEKCRPGEPSPCDMKRDAAAPRAAALAGGGLALLAGAGLILWARPHPAARVTVTPGGLVYAGRF